MAAMSIVLLFTNQGFGLSAANFGKVMASGFVVLASFYLIFHLYKKEMKALKLCFWFCLLSIISIESESFSIGLNYGVTVGTVFEIGTAIVTINILALLALFFTGKIMLGQKRLTRL